MTIESPAALLDALRRSQVLEPEQLDELTPDTLSRFPDAKGLARDLMQRGWLTPYQVNQVFQGKGADLVLGQYLFLERLGEGGMGQVFKARHRKMHRIVAIKLLRKERLAHPDAIKRFHREVRAVGQLSHPHIVLAFDADEIQGTHFFAMEYVEGIDLARLIKERGPLPAAEAVEYVRQAALGLQHAHEAGLVHRDVKPSNLLLQKQRTGSSAGAQVKVLDLGLARLQPSPDGQASSLVTREGLVMGTPDFIAPEQTANSSTVDIRADLYSLGCTLYFLLTGRPPFPRGTAMEKLLKHRIEAPKPLDQLRPDVPPALVSVVQRLMAKKPADRFQTPAELATVLDQLDVPTAPAPDLPVLTAAGDAPTSTSSVHWSSVVAARRGPGTRRGWRSLAWLLLVSVLLAVLVGGFAWLLQLVQREAG